MSGAGRRRSARGRWAALCPHAAKTRRLDALCLCLTSANSKSQSLVMQPHKILRTLTVAAMLLGLYGCAEVIDTSPKRDWTFTPSAVTTRLTALIVGRLSLQGNCLRVNGHLLAWPAEITVSIEGVTVKVEDGLSKDEAVWQIGQDVQLGGGEVQPQYLTEAVRRRVPANCGGPYWLVGDIVVPRTPSP